MPILDSLQSPRRPTTGNAPSPACW